MYIFMMCVLLTFPLTVNVAYGASIDDLISETQENSGNSENSNGTNREPMGANEFVDSMKDSIDLTQSTGEPIVSEARRAITHWGSVGAQILAYGISVLLTFKVIIDCAYLGLPFTRSFLGGGMQPSMAQGQGQGGMGMGGMGMNGMSGFGGMGGMRSGFGGMGMGGMRSGYGGMGGMGGMSGMGGMGGQAAPAGPAMGIQWVSMSAINAAAMEGQIGPDGKKVSKWKDYASDMVVTLIVVPLLITLAMTGVISNISFFLLDLIVSAVEGITG